MAIKAFAGRETELQLLEGHVSRTFGAKQGSVVFIPGETEAGKSELIHQRKDRVL